MSEAQFHSCVPNFNNLESPVCRMLAIDGWLSSFPNYCFFITEDLFLVSVLPLVHSYIYFKSHFVGLFLTLTFSQISDFVRNNVLWIWAVKHVCSSATDIWIYDIIEVFVSWSLIYTKALVITDPVSFNAELHVGLN